MKIAHSVTIRTFENDLDLSEDNYSSLFENILPTEIFEILKSPENCKKEKIEFLVEKLTVRDALRVRNEASKITNGTDITLMKVNLTKDKQINSFLEFLKEKLGAEQCSLVISQENRVDEDCNFFIRINKSELKKGNFVLTDSGDCYNIKIKLAAYPKKKEAGLKLVKEILQ